MNKNSNLKRKIITTSDGSKTIQIEDWDEQYHSKHGAIQEANHVFIKHGLKYYSETILQEGDGVSILEIGFGTGLNAFITFLETQHLNIKYTGVEAYPISEEELEALNYAELISVKNSNIFKALHQTKWEIENSITPNFIFKKRQQLFQDIDDKNKFDLIYFDAFGARVQPELWTEIIFNKMYNALKNNGVLVTYSAKGSVRRAMQSVGFTVEKLEGPPGKREMLRALKKV